MHILCMQKQCIQDRQNHYQTADILLLNKTLNKTTPNYVQRRTVLFTAHKHTAGSCAVA